MEEEFIELLDEMLIHLNKHPDNFIKHGSRFHKELRLHLYKYHENEKDGYLPNN